VSRLDRFGILPRFESRMRSFLLILTLGLATLHAAGAQTDSLSVTYVGNEGFLIEGGEHKVLIDALYRSGVSGYVVHSPDVRKLLERGLAPFDSVDVVLATHYHADHFDPDAVGIHLLSDRDAIFVSTPQAAQQMETYKGYRNIQARITGLLPPEGETETVEHDGVSIRVLNLHHGRNRPVENLGFIVDINGHTLLHIGDTEVSPDEMRDFAWDEESIDYFFVPYWMLLDHAGAEIVDLVRPKAIGPMHLPPPEDPRDYLNGSGGFDGTIEQIQATYPQAIVFRGVMSTKRLP